MKILCVCAGGVCRSVAAAKLLQEAGHKTIAIGAEYNGVRCEDVAWADHIIAFLPGGKKAIEAAKLHNKPYTIIEQDDVWGFWEDAKPHIKLLLQAVSLL